MTLSPERLRWARARYATELGWPHGSSLENWAAIQLTRWGHGPERVRREHRVGRYRLDFAWPEVMVALELDGWHHRAPEGAAKDAARDSELRAAGWLILRVDDRSEEDIREEQLLRVVEVVNALGEHRGG